MVRLNLGIWEVRFNPAVGVLGDPLVNWCSGTGNNDTWHHGLSLGTRER